MSESSEEEVVESGGAGGGKKRRGKQQIDPYTVRSSRRARTKRASTIVSHRFPHYVKELARGCKGLALVIVATEAGNYRTMHAGLGMSPFKFLNLWVKSHMAAERTAGAFHVVRRSTRGRRISLSRQRRHHVNHPPPGLS